MSSFEGVADATRKVMQANKSKHTKPEMIVRRMLHAMGYRYRLHVKVLPGQPDLTFGSRKKAIFVHGCFWHQHEAAGCRGARMPKIRQDYWRAKLEGNKARDERSIAALGLIGWQAFVVWECQLKDWNLLRDQLQTFLGEPLMDKRR